jgi:transposase
MLPASAGGDRVPVIAQLVRADEDTVRDVIHRFNGIGLACLDPRWAGGRPRQLSDGDEDFAIGPQRQFTVANSTHPDHPVRTQAPARLSTPA